MDIKVLISIKNPVTLYHAFKDIFFKYIIDNLAEEELASEMIEYYLSHDFTLLRMLIEEEVTDKADISLLNKVNNINDEINDTAYRTWKTIDNMFSSYLDLNDELTLPKRK
jgi:6-pyruvoyl-tetrahydropterin synthase